MNETCLAPQRQIDVTFHRTMLLVVAVLGVSVLSSSQVKGVRSEDVMEAALDMKRTVEQADKLEVLGAQYCRWGVSSVNASDLEIAISRYLLNRRSTVPVKIAASQMWHGSLVAGDEYHQLAVGILQCDVNLRYSDGARSVAVSGASILFKMGLARGKFDELAYQQTRWQAESASLHTGNTDGQDELGSEKSRRGSMTKLTDVLTTAREIKEAAEGAAKITADAANTRGCLRPIEPPTFTYLSKLIDYMEHAPHPPSYIPAANMWGANGEALAAQLGIFSTLEACLPSAGDKKKVRTVSENALRAYHRLTKAIVAFDLLALQQTEWEENTLQKQDPTREQ